MTENHCLGKSTSYVFLLGRPAPPIPSREDGTTTEARRNQWNRQRPSAVRSGAAWSTPPARARVIFFLKTSRRERRVAPAALRLPGLARAVRPDRLGL